MKIQDDQKAYYVQLDMLRDKKQALTKLLKDNENNSGGAQNFDRVEIFHKLAIVNGQYEATMGVREDIIATSVAIHNGEVGALTISRQRFTRLSGPVCSGRSCSLGASTPLFPSIFCVVWVSVWVKTVPLLRQNRLEQRDRFQKFCVVIVA